MKRTAVARATARSAPQKGHFSHFWANNVAMWMLILISPRRSRCLITILSSMRRYGIAEVKQALRATFDSKRTPLICVDGPPIVSWDIQYPFSAKESSRSCNGGSLALVHIASILSDIPLATHFDASIV